MKIQTEEKNTPKTRTSTKFHEENSQVTETIRNEQHPQAEKTTTIKVNKKHATGVEVNFPMLTNVQHSGKRAARAEKQTILLESVDQHHNKKWDETNEREATQDHSTR